MLTLNKKTILISVIVFVVIALVILNVFLFLNWQTKQKEAQRQAKAAADIQVVQNLISLKKFDLLVSAELQKQGLAQVAIDLAEKAVKAESNRQAQGQLQPEEISLNNKIAPILSRYLNYGSSDKLSNDEAAAILKEISPSIVSDLKKNTFSADYDLRQNAYFSLGILGYTYMDMQPEITPIFLRGLKDSAVQIGAISALNLLAYGQKEGLPVLVSDLDPQYKNITMASEPPLILPVYSYRGLLYFTDQTFSQDQVIWQNWWDANKDKIYWSADQSKFITP